MQETANGLIEPSPLIAARSQALVKCWRLATTFPDWNCSSFSSSPPQRSSPLTSQALFVTSQNNCLFNTGAQLKTNIFLQWSTHQETTGLLISGPTDAPLCSPECLPARTKSSHWLEARTVPALSCCSPSVHQAKPCYSRHNEDFHQRAEPESRAGGQKRGLENR